MADRILQDKINHIRMIVLSVQEKTAIVVMSLVILICLSCTLLFDSMGKETFSVPYTHGMSDGTLVSLSGTVEKVTDITGGHTILEVSGVSVFIPVSAGLIPVLHEADHVSLTGTIQKYKGKEEIIVTKSSDIRISQGSQGIDQHFELSGSGNQD